MLHLTLCILAVANALALPANQTFEPSIANNVVSSIRLRTLIVGSTSDAVILPENVVQGYGAPYDIILGSQPPLDGDDWHSIVVADSGVNNTWVREYAARTHARIVFLQSVEDAQDAELLGVDSVPTPISNVTVADTDSARYLAGVFNTTSSWNVSEIAPMAVSVLNTSIATPYLVFDNANKTADLSAAAFVTNTTLGTQEMHFRFRANEAALTADFEPFYTLPTEFTQMNLALGHSWFEWVTRGVFLGYRRLTLNIHVDDWFINSAIRYTDEIYRINSSDVETYVEWRKNFHDNVLPTGSEFKLEPAYNGAGLGMTGYNDTSLNEATYTYADEFNWVSHTWSHMNMDWLEDWQCDGQHKVCHPLPEHYDAELGYNQKVARGEGIASDEYIELYYGEDATPPHQFLDNRTELMQYHYSVKSLVTPEISGLWPASYNGTPPTGRVPYLKNTLFFSKLVEYGIENVVGDNSRPELNNELMYHGVFSTVEEYGYDGILIVPRWSPNIPFNCKTLECAVQFYDTEGACSWTTYGPACDPDKVWDGPGVINREAKASTIPLLQQRWDPYMFHQSNVHAQPYRGGFAPLVGQFVQEVAEDVLRYITGLPFVSIKMDDLAVMYRERMTRDDAKQYGTLQMNAAGEPVSVSVSGCEDFNSVVTITTNSPLSFAEQVNVTLYGTDVSAFKLVTPDQPAVFNVTGSII
ncbi:hypothetical protein SARC_06867 [Sphaeroforma arctica JP610]|uniref:Agd3 deacetylase domain-containing protein n=1 Tax=Sphaeroforma arctica JP610 TaxID=667725 RepID=A0A0L0FXU6_9EUKA|nr:hypothetical protein SARC_06867 [Sphaeroforma arctica JP610]KNC80788.1 hypothetical protein SARC_06867 [Sphaeroforma arctica JP610]|eukprot:XP_014154690.1 hypothetical protein SARC_06867 [Sphaeroforma arctica JP610]